DEIGATLSGIALYSELTKTQMQAHKQEDVQQSLERMQQSATEMVHKLSDIVWAVNPAKDSLEELWQKLDDYARQIASTKNIKVLNEAALSASDIKLSMEDRRNIYLLLKESINNAVKYSGCSLIKLNIAKKSNQLHFMISDDGKGFDQQCLSKGNGLLFMNHRARELNAQLLIESAVNTGTSLQLVLKYPNEGLL
ncbi:MAG TPA: ATP-binding protein, partial [Flavisolibacter sp.]|nr:ATP-binding protein [Flavisolibacter sp.]